MKNRIILGSANFDQTYGINRNLIRNIGRHANYVKYDGQGRIAIPEILLKSSNIKRDVVVIGMLKKIELWVLFLFFILFFVILIFYGAVLKHHHKGGERFPKIQKAKFITLKLSKAELPTPPELGEISF